MTPYTNHTAWCGNTVFFSVQCFAERQDPSLLRLSNGRLAVAFGLTTPVNSSPCFTNNSTAARIGFEVSPDNGATFGPIQYVTGSDSKTCPFFQEIEPSFATSANGTVYGVYVAANATPYDLTGFGGPFLNYYHRPHDALAFVQSATGAVFSPSKVIIAGGNISRPQIAVYGKSIYVAYENISNGSSILPGTYSNVPVASELVYSNDSGATWHGPYLLPGENGSSLNTTLSPSIGVTPGGMVVVAYATNRSCMAACASFFPIDRVFGEQIVVATSMTNGTRWTAPIPVSKTLQAEPGFVGGASNYYGAYLESLFQYAPNTALAMDSATGHWYVAWSASYNLSNNPYSIFGDYYHPALFAGVSTNGGASWASSRVSPPLSTDTSTYEEAYFNPGLGVSGGTVYLTYTYFLYSFGGSCGPAAPNPQSIRFTQDLSTSTNGLTWTGPLDVSVGAAYSPGYFADLGYHGSVAFDGSGRPILAYVYENGQSLFDPTFPHSITPVPLVVARPYLGPTVVVQFAANGLPGGTQWGFSVSGNVFANLTGPGVNITNVPRNVSVIIAFQKAPVAGGYATVFLAGASGAAVLAFATNTTYAFQLTQWYGFGFAVSPSNPAYFSIQIYNFTANWNYYHQWQFNIFYNGTGYSIQIIQSGCPFPWYLPVGYKFSLSPSFFGSSSYNSPIPVSHWAGTGAGNYTGSGATANITMSGPVNETAYMQPFSGYPVNFVPHGLPSTSTYQFTLDGTPHSAAGNVPITVPGLTTGAHFLSNVGATSTMSGWAYYGQARTGNPVLVPNTPVVDLDFALVNTASSPGPVYLHATGLTAGTVWSISFNGTTYSSSTPWINVTVRNGTYPVNGYPAVSPNGSATFAPLGLGSNLTVLTGTTYDVPFVPTFQVTVIASRGGTVAPSGSSFWLAPGAKASFTATAATGFAFESWTGSGPGSYTGTNHTANVTASGPIVETANFIPLPPARFNVTITETGLPAGTLWTAVVGGTGYSSVTATISVPNSYSCAVSGPLGQYSLNVPFAFVNGTPGVRFVPNAYPGTVCGGTTLPVVFQTQFYLTIGATPGGNVTAAVGAIITSHPVWASSGQVIDLQAQPAPGYVFVAWNGSGPGNYTGGLSATSFTLLGPVSELGVFAPAPPAGPPTYYVDFHESTALPAGTTWSVTFAGGTYSSTSSWINVTGVLAGSHALAVATIFGPSGLVRFTPSNPPPSVSVTGNNSAGVPIAFGTDYWVRITVIGSGTVTPASRWDAAGSMIALSAAPASGSVFIGWSGMGVGAYSGLVASENVTVNAPIEEVATFALAPAIVQSTTSLFQNPLVWGALGAGGLVLGLVVGVLLGRRRSPPTMLLTPETRVSAAVPAAPPTPSWSEETPPSGGGSG
ncbi:MAG: hypothetical protein L3K14_03400 [Thermoplasmata archaeon]|nr:hypothetical protein [Thermoplasmata archaeon]